MPVIVVTGTRGIPDILGGVETHCEELLPRIAAKGYRVIIVRRKHYVHAPGRDAYPETPSYTDDAGGTSVCPESRTYTNDAGGTSVRPNDRLPSYKGVMLYDIPNVKIKSFEAIVHTFRAIWNARWRFHADIIHIHSIGPALLTPFARLLRLKVVFTHHGPDYDRAKWGWVAKCMLRLGERTGCRFAHQVIVISNVINELIQRKYNRHDAHLIPNGVPPPLWTDDTGYLDVLGVEARKFIFAMGRFVPEKNFHLLVDAFESLQLTGYRLVIAGDSDREDAYSRTLKATARTKGVVLTGFIKGHKLHTLLSHAALFVLPSSHEGLPIALLEAMSYGLPVLASDIPANREVPLPSSCYFRLDLSQRAPKGHVPANLSQRRPTSDAPANLSQREPTGDAPANLSQREPTNDAPANLSQRGHYLPPESDLPGFRDALSLRLRDLTPPVYDLSAYNWDQIANQTEQVYSYLVDRQ